ncbi:MAG: class I SAM-dependent methyltransferase [Terriglobia bacterium]
MKHLTNVGYWEENVWKKQRPRRLILHRDHDFELVRLLRQITPRRNSRVLEVGAGGSLVLPHLARHAGFRATGIDYSLSGCRLFANNFRVLGIAGDIVCDDFLQSSIRPGQFDMVYSLGLIEHFDDLAGVVRAHLNFLKPGGILFLVSPNLQGLHGKSLRRLAPALLARHRVFGPSELGDTFHAAGIESVKTGYLGSFYFTLGADSDWVYLRNWPGVFRSSLRYAVRFTNACISLAFRLSPWRPHSRTFSPAFYAVGQKPRGFPPARE